MAPCRCSLLSVSRLSFLIKLVIFVVAEEVVLVLVEELILVLLVISEDVEEVA